MQFSNRIKLFLLLFTLALSVSLSLVRRWPIDVFDYHATIFSDKAGYYIYLPAAFKYHFDTERMPAKLDKNLGDGFVINHESKKIITKYPCGVALLQMPFYLPVYLLAKPFNYGSEGFSPIYQKTIDICGVVYLILGLVFLWKFLAFYFNDKIIFLSLLYLYCCTNLLYFGTYEAGMSHVFSFFVVNMFLFYWKKSSVEGVISVQRWVLFSACITLIWLIRPVNLLFIPFVLMLDASSVKLVSGFIKENLSAKKIVVSLTVVFLFASPQLAYNMYAYGNLIADSYRNEGFDNLYSPKIAEVLFAARNGFFIYNPLYLLAIAGMFVMMLHKNRNGLVLLGLFSAITFVYAGWWSWELGCSLGHRGYVDFYGLLVIPFAVVAERMWRKPAPRAALISLLTVFAAYNLKFYWTYDGCFSGATDWDYQRWKYWVFEAGLPSYF